MKDLSPPNAVDLEIFKNLFASIAEEMGMRLMRSAFSPNIKERRDHSCAIFDARAEMIAQAAHIPVHLGSTPMSVQAAIEAIGTENMTADTRIILNDPFAGGTHLPDITLVAPFIVNGSPLFFVANRAHHADVGGITAGSMPLSTHIDEEGFRIQATQLDEDVIQSLCDASRTPHERLGDLQAQRAAIHTGLERLQELCTRYGPETAAHMAKHLQNYSERITRAILREAPNGSWTFSDCLDDDGFGNHDLQIKCKLSIQDDEAILDFSESAPQTKGPVNAVRAITVSAVNYAFRCLAPEDLPSNGGTMRPVQVITPPSSIVDASYPSPVAAGNVETSQRITDVVFGALALAFPHRIPAASCGSMNNITIGGHDPRTETPFAYYETLAGGSGASPSQPGSDAIHTHMTNTLNTPIESFEHAYPLRIDQYAIRDTPNHPNDIHAGGRGLVRTYHFTTPCEVTLLTERRRHAPYGLHGGSSGTKGQNILTHNDGAVEHLPPKTTFQAKPGDSLEIQTPGGGGWGSHK